jgi:Domain of unknown function (DUF5069)
MSHYHWVAQFQRCYDMAVQQYRQGNRQPATYFNTEESAFLAQIGCTAQEVYDFAEDICQDGVPSFGDALLITSARRDYFLTIQKGQPTGKAIQMADLPAKDAEVAGFRWLPRIIAKARAKLRGELPAELMYGCGGDRRFLSSVNIHPADFLRHVWAARDDDQRIIEYVQRQAARSKQV